MSWSAVAGAGVSLIGGALSSNNSSDANKAAQEAYTRAYYNNQANMQPYLNAGTDALNQMTQLNSGNYSSFQESPDYQFTLSQGLQGLDRSAAARGSLYSGGQSADVTNYASGLASQQYNNYYNKLSSLAGMGQSSASSLAGVNNTYANQTASTAYNDASNSNALTGLYTGVASNLLSNLGTGSSRSSAYNNLLTGQASTGSGSSYNFGNNLGSFTGSWY